MARKLIRILTGAALAVLSLIAYPAAAEEQVFNCARHSEVVEFLGSHYAETLHAVALINEDAILELYVSDSGSWTMLVTSVAGHSCVVFAGQGFETISPVPGVET